MERITFEEMWVKLEKYLKVDNALEQGFSNGKFTKVLASRAKHVVGIDIDPNFMKIATENLKEYNNVELFLMNAKKTTFKDKEFDVLLNTSFHEFDLSHGTFSMNLELKKEILTEMIRLSDTIIFIEPTENALTNELFKVFDPSENHGYRIGKSNELIREFMNDNNYELIETGLTYNDDKFRSQEELEEEMLDWWADIKVPANEKEKKAMIAQIDAILEKAGVLKDLHVIEELRYNVYKRKSEI